MFGLLVSLDQPQINLTHSAENNWEKGTITEPKSHITPVSHSYIHRLNYLIPIQQILELILQSITAHIAVYIDAPH